MKRIILGTCIALFGAASFAAEPASKADPRALIASKFPGVTAQDVRPSPIAGVYEVRLGIDRAYVSADGVYVIAGDLYELESRTNLTEQGRSKVRKEALAKVDRRDMIVFAPAAPKHTVTVFTDVDCGYCRKLHKEIGQLTSLGVEVRYLAYPRSGPGSPDWSKMEAVWCAKDRKAAITKAKRGESVSASGCGATPVAKQFALGEQLGVRGTPAIFDEAGDYLGGYLPPIELKQRLEELSAAR